MATVNASASATIWTLAERAVIAGDAPQLEQLLADHDPILRGDRPRSTWLDLSPECPGTYRLQAASGSRDARAIIVDKHHFESWDQFALFTAALADPHSGIARFESAAEAVVDGDVAALARLLREQPELRQARSARRHHATLLHYVGANGVEGFRQRTPRNAVQTAEILLDAGAEVDASADMYGGGVTTLGLVATSVHPHAAGLQMALIDLLLSRGAALDRERAAGDARGLVSSCLANGQGEAAAYLASRGAIMDLEAAAGAGRLDAVTRFFDADGRLNASATPAQMKDGFAWACLYGRAEVVEFLLQRGASVVATDATWHSTPLGWALYGWGQRPAGSVPQYYEVVTALVAAGSAVKPEWLSNERVRGDARMVTALRGDAA